MGEQSILIVTAVEAEREAVLKAVGSLPHIRVIAAGVGSAMAAASTAKELAGGSFDFVLNVGIAGGFKGKATIGSVVIADHIIIGDLRAESEEAYIYAEELGFGTAKFDVPSILINDVVGKLKGELEDSQVQVGSILTVSTVTGTEKTAQLWQRQFPHAIAEAMEGYGVACAASLYELPCLEIRTISNEVGPRDKGKWKMKEALMQLTNTMNIIFGGNTDA